MNKIKALRKALGLTQADIAIPLGIDRATVANWERGISFPRTAMLVSLANLLHCDVETLVIDRYPDGGEEVYRLKEIREKANLFEPISDSGSAPQYLNNKFRELRMERNLTQAELIEQYNQRYNRTYSIPALSLFENGRRMPELPALMDFARFFNCSLDYLVGMEPEETLGDRLSTARRNAGLTQPEVESYTGINYKTISNWENNVSNPSPAEIVTLCYLYDVSADDLLGVKRMKGD